MEKSYQEISLRGWRDEFVNRLEKHRPANGEKWISFAKALKISGISNNQLSLLRYHRVILCRRHPHKLHPITRKKVFLYPKSQVELAGRVYREFSK